MILDVIRHASTEWNAQGRMQGRRDIPLSLGGRGELLRWRVPLDAQHASWFSSPLVRAVETARGLTSRAIHLEPALVEMDWGVWEGATLDEMRAGYGEAFVANEHRGWDFRPGGGESPREVLIRVRAWIDAIAEDKQTVVAVTHKGVLRVIFAAASGWNMLGKPPRRLMPACMHRFAVDERSRLSIIECNITLVVGATL